MTQNSAKEVATNDAKQWRAQMCLGVLALRDGISTARYFEAAGERIGCKIVRLKAPLDSTAGVNLDAVLVIDPCLTSPGALRRIDSPVIGVLIDVHQELSIRLAYARYFDHVFVAQPDYLPQFRALPHPSTHWLPLACDPDVHFIPGQERIHEVGFVGKFGVRGSGRFDTLTRVLEQFVTNDTTRTYSPREMGAIYSRSKIVFNKSINGDLNMRFFEGLAAGALVVTDRIGNGLADVAREGEHYVGYSSVEEAIAVIRHYLAHDGEREAIARRGQAHAFTHHTYASRMARILEAMHRPDAKAPARSAPLKLEALFRSECMRIQGARFREVMGLVAEGNLSGASAISAATALARGVGRPLRQHWQRWRRMGNRG
jgi:Glycosyl transferases group 1